jgi:FKBP-type peptidyl-prolyl cis-trans isomerase FklB
MKACLPALVLCAAVAFAGASGAQTKSTPSAQKVVPTKVKITDPPPKPVADPAAEFMATNAKAPGVITLPSGLQYKVVHAGDPKGPSPKPGDVVKVHYEGKLLDGAVFDSSFQRGKPMLAPLGGLVPGWMEALPMMHVGDEWTLYVPPSLGYGDKGGGPIPPNSVMIFRIQLLGMLAGD